MRALTEQEAAALALSVGGELTVDGRTFNAEHEEMSVRQPGPKPAPAQQVAAPAKPEPDKIFEAVAYMARSLQITIGDLAQLLAQQQPVVVVQAPAASRASYSVRRDATGVPVALVRVVDGAAEEIPVDFGRVRA
jgi:hypothetical protein